MANAIRFNFPREINIWKSPIDFHTLFDISIETKGNFGLSYHVNFIRVVRNDIQEYVGDYLFNGNVNFFSYP